ncbi:uncharacterized protein LOC117069093 [Trachypithecus francoisi]|uniref:uncharacterized protein LOC117069093 n=1 Tax=Trachypithecus francoisi TaxID=54180 RepID=UPI00141AC6DE|nr:uncharacterized protein LOC117069093 [Trachypithecus francoisi]
MKWQFGGQDIVPPSPKKVPRGLHPTSLLFRNDPEGLEVSGGHHEEPLNSDAVPVPSLSQAISIPAVFAKPLKVLQAPRRPRPANSVQNRFPKRPVGGTRDPEPHPGSLQFRGKGSRSPSQTAGVALSLGMRPRREQGRSGAFLLLPSFSSLTPEMLGPASLPGGQASGLAPVLPHPTPGSPSCRLNLEGWVLLELPARPAPLLFPEATDTLEILLWEKPVTMWGGH